MTVISESTLLHSMLSERRSRGARPPSNRAERAPPEVVEGEQHDERDQGDGENQIDRFDRAHAGELHGNDERRRLVGQQRRREAWHLHPWSPPRSTPRPTTVGFRGRAAL